MHIIQLVLHSMKLAHLQALLCPSTSPLSPLRPFLSQPFPTMRLNSLRSQWMRPSDVSRSMTRRIWSNTTWGCVSSFTCTLAWARERERQWERGREGEQCTGHHGKLINNNQHGYAPLPSNMLANATPSRKHGTSFISH